MDNAPFEQGPSSRTPAGELSLLFPFIDEHLYVVEKPPAMHSVGDEDSLASTLRTTYPKLAELEDAGLVQRLDFETTGIIAGGFNPKVQTDLRYALSLGKFSKSYLVLAEGRCAKNEVVEGYLFSRYRGSAKVSMQQKAIKRGLFSRSLVVPLETIGDVTLVRVDCALARRHQVRVHMAALGFPLVGDTLYGSKRSLSQIGLGDHRSAFVLVAESLAFAHPVTEQTISCHASISAKTLLERLQSGRSAV